MHHIQLLPALKKISADLVKKLAEERNPLHIDQYQQQLRQINKEVKRIEGMRSYMN